MSAPPPRFELDAAVRRRDHGQLLVGGTPPRLVRLSEAGAAALAAILAGDDDPTPRPGGRPLARPSVRGRPLARPTGQRTTALRGAEVRTTAVAALRRRLERDGLLHPLPGDGADGPEVTTVVPVLDGGAQLADLVRTLAAEGPVIVVDDGSGDGSPALAAAAGARVIANAGLPGPAGARNTGLRAATTELVAFVDADCTVAPGWRRGLAGLLADDPDLALVGPRVRSLPGHGALARYERRTSPLDLGPHASLVGPRRRVAYLPAAALLARRTALLELGGFDESMRFGEDVDLTWRLLDAGHRVRYVPAREVLHRPRPTLPALLAQRAGYGASAPDLAARHGDAVAPLRVGPHSAAVWTVAALRPRLAPAALAASLALVAWRRGRGAPGAPRELARLTLQGHLDATGHLSRALLREWLPASLALALTSRRARPALAIALAVEASRGAPALRLLDHAGYAAGLWREAARRRDPTALLPALEGLGRIVAVRRTSSSPVRGYSSAGRAPGSQSGGRRFDPA